MANSAFWWQVKRSFIIALIFFELGSLLCGIAPSSKVLIVGRAIEGIGDGGIFAGSFTILASTGRSLSELLLNYFPLLPDNQCLSDEGLLRWAVLAQCLGLHPLQDLCLEDCLQTSFLGGGVF